MDALTCMLTRSSVKKYKSDPVPKELMDKVIEAGLAAPSWRVNSHVYRHGDGGGVLARVRLWEFSLFENFIKHLGAARRLRAVGGGSVFACATSQRLRLSA